MPGVGPEGPEDIGLRTEAGLAMLPGHLWRRLLRQAELPEVLPADGEVEGWLLLPAGRISLLRGELGAGEGLLLPTGVGVLRRTQGMPGDADERHWRDGDGGAGGGGA